MGVLVALDMGTSIISFTRLQLGTDDNILLYTCTNSTSHKSMQFCLHPKHLGQKNFDTDLKELLVSLNVLQFTTSHTVY